MLSKNNLFSIVKYLIGWPLSLVALIFIFKVVFTNFSKTVSSIVNINPYLLLVGVTFFVVYFFLRAYLWMLILGKSSKLFTFKENLLYWSVSELKRFVPGSIWSFASRATSFEREELSKKQILIFIAHEGILIALSSLIFSLFYVYNFWHSQTLNYLLLAFCISASLVFVFGSKFLEVYKKENVVRKVAYFFLPSNSYFENFKILLLGVFTFFVFGLGSYFSTVSLFYLDLRNILIVSSLFAFSYFIGYVSIITPMGLGVREGVSTFGLSFFLTQTLSATASIFTRTISIVSEIISIVIVLLINKIKSTKLKRIEDFIFNHKHAIVLCVFIGIYIAYFSVASFLRYSNFYTGRFDLGNMDQTVWNTTHGRIFQLTDPDGVNNISRLSVHADFILILISPLYLIWSNPKMLLLLQSIVLGLGAIFVYLISKEVLKNKNISLAFAAAFLLSPAIEYVNLYDFHPVALATTFLLATFYFYKKKKYIWFLLFAILSGLTKEEVWAIIGIFGLFILIRSIREDAKGKNLEKIFGSSLFIFGFGFSYLLISKIIPFVKGGDHFALSYYADFGNSPTEIIKTILFNPIKTLSTLFEHTRISYLSQLIGPLGFLSFLAPAFLIFAVPDLMISLLSNNPQLHQIYYQYSASIMPFIFISAIYGTKIAVEKIKYLDYQKISIYILIMSLFYLYVTGPIAGSKKANLDMFSKQLVNSTTVSKFLSSIPKKYSIAATNNLGSHLSRRENIYTIPYGIDRADVLVFLLNDGSAQPTLSQQKIMANNLKSDPKYVLLFSDNDFIAFARKSAKVTLKK